jgi:hypothetical protein
MQGQLNWPMAPSCEKPLPSFYSSGSLKWNGKHENILLTIKKLSHSFIICCNSIDPLFKIVFYARNIWLLILLMSPYSNVIASVRFFFFFFFWWWNSRPHTC